MVRESNPEINLDEQLDQDYNMYSEIGASITKVRNKQMSKISEEPEEIKKATNDE